MMPPYKDYLERAYSELTTATLSTWSHHHSPGAFRGHPYPPDRIAISTGSLVEPSGTLRDLRHSLQVVAQADSTLEITRCLHFTFLGLSRGISSSTGDLPPELHHVRRIWREYASVQFNICDLRLVPLPAALLLAGIPFSELYEARRTFAHAVLETAWAPFLKSRYEGYDFPPVFWHTTLARSHTQYATAPLRDLYFRYQDAAFDDLHLAPPMLVATNYDWSQFIPLDS